MKKVLLKDLLFNESKITKIATEIYSVNPVFKKDDFICDVIAELPKLELKARISWIAQCLKQYLPENYQQATSIIIASLPAANNPNLSDNDFGDFIYASYADFIAKNGCNKSDLSFSLNALYEITQRFSAEDAIRYFINAFPSETLQELQKWSKDSNYHVRRLCSEGTRPKLPWSKKINIPLHNAVAILDNLVIDKTRFVTRSVANHINDISKIDSDLAIKILTKWQESHEKLDKEWHYIVHHSLRSLIKNGNLKALEFLGVTHNPNIKIFDVKVSKEVKMNSALEFSFVIQAYETTKIIVDYIIYFCNKSGNTNRKKVFKFKNFSLAENESLILKKNHILYENMTTRKLFFGQHIIEININGKSYEKKSFLLY